MVEHRVPPGAQNEAEERTLWSGRPSQFVNTRIFLVSVLQALAILGLAGALSVWLDGEVFLAAHEGKVLAVVAVLALAPLARALWKALEVRFHRYDVTSQRLRIRRGVLSRLTQEVELYRVKDLTLAEPFLYRLMGLSSIHLHTSDRSHPLVMIRAVRNGDGLREQLRACVEQQRKLHGVRELDV